MNDLEAALGLEGIETFDEFFKKRKNNLYKMLDLTKDLSEYCYFIREEKYEKVSPHAFPLVLKDKKYNRNKLYQHLESKGIQCKTLFGSLPTQHNAFKFLKYKYGDFPVSEYIGDNGLHFGMHQYINDDDLEFINDALNSYFKEFR
jgi:dTDP-4-amino-4,6-dideoxygalactose transaminase